MDIGSLKLLLTANFHTGFQTGLNNERHADLLIKLEAAAKHIVAMIDDL